VTRCALDAVDRLYTAAESKALDRIAIDGHGIAGIVLMKRAGRAVFETLIDYWPDARCLSIVAGRGNNAGDGYIVAGLAVARGLSVQVVQLGAPERLTGDAARARDWAVAQGVDIQVQDEEAPAFEIRGDVIVDALLGTGVSGEVRPGFARAIDTVNASGCPVVAVDLPSGLCADTGRVLGTVVRAAVTVTFIGVKRGLVTGAGPDCAGAILFDDLDVPAAVRAEVPGIEALHWERLSPLLPRRPATAHKSVSGHLVVIGGDLGMGGAVLLAAEAALRSGAGLVSVVTRPEHVAAVLARRPEVMVRGFGESLEGDPNALDALLGRASALAVGPGLGRSAWSRALLDRALACAVPLVLDADALNLLGETGRRATGPCVVTPHPGEAGRLLGIPTAAVQADRFAAARRLVQALDATVVLKGAGTVVDDGAGIGVCLHGNEGMASAGMGDVLTGVVGSLLAQGMNPATAARAGACLHSRAGDEAAAIDGRRGLIATDLIAALRGLTNAPPG
jgi:NAD(P)H-hydrate epimerase